MKTEIKSKLSIKALNKLMNKLDAEQKAAKKLKPAGAACPPSNINNKK